MQIPITRAQILQGGSHAYHVLIAVAALGLFVQHLLF